MIYCSLCDFGGKKLHLTKEIYAMQDKKELVEELRKAVLGSDFDENDPEKNRTQFKEETNSLVIKDQRPINMVKEEEVPVMSEEELFAKLLQQTRSEKRK